MARVSADTLKTATASNARGTRRRPTSTGNGAQAPAVTEEPEEAEELVEAADDDSTVDEPAEEREAAPESAPAQAPRAATSRSTTQRAVSAESRTQAAAATQAATTADPNVIALGKLLRMSLEYGIPVEDLVERLRAMVEAYEQAKG